jgi:hypothetical protein
MNANAISLVNAPIAVLVGVGESASCDRAAKASVVEFLVKGAEAGFDVAEALATSQLSEGRA